MDIGVKKKKEQIIKNNTYCRLDKICKCCTKSTVNFILRKKTNFGGVTVYLEQWEMFQRMNSLIYPSTPQSTLNEYLIN